MRVEREKRVYGIYLVFIFILSLTALYEQMRERMEKEYDYSTTEVRKHLKASQNSFDNFSHDFYYDHNDYISKILFRAEDGRESVERLQREMADTLYASFRNIRLFGLESFGVYDKSGRRFVHFEGNRIDFGREYSTEWPVKMVMKEKRFLKGFESSDGKIGFEYLYALFYDGEFVGGYEWKWGLYPLVEEMRKVYSGEFGVLVVDGDEVDTSPVEGIEGFGYPAELQRYYGERQMRCLSGLADGDMVSRLKLGRDFAFFFETDGRWKEAVFIGIRDIEGEFVGYLFHIGDGSIYGDMKRVFYTELIFLMVIIALVYLLLEKSFRDRVHVRTLIDSQSDIVILTNGRRILDTNRRFLEFFGVRSMEEFVKKHSCICDFFRGGEGYLQKVNDGKGWLEFIIENDSRRHKVKIYDSEREEERIFLVSANRFGNTGEYVITLHDITDFESEKQRLRIESTIDFSTKIYNKRAFESYIAMTIEDMAKGVKRHPVSLILFDIDRFKSINDNFGHGNGDHILLRLSSLVQSSIRKGDFLARWGGDEFVIVVEGADREVAVGIAEKIRKKISQADFDIGMAVTCSFGVTQIRSGDTPKTLLARVDGALYEAKNSGRDRVSYV
jgi:diguanylate cyclase (GGDEF)-like protein